MTEEQQSQFQKSKNSIWKKWWFLIIVVFIFFMIMGTVGEEIGFISWLDQIDFEEIGYKIGYWIGEKIVWIMPIIIFFALFWLLKVIKKTTKS